MFGTRPVPTPVRGRSILALSALALLAFCCAPVLAQASSAGYVYSDAPPTSTGAPPSESNLQGGSPTKGGGGSGGANGAKHGGTGGGANGSNAKGGGGTNGAGAGQTGQGAGGETGVGASQSLTGAEPGSDSGSSSPLVPILIAIVLLAGGSVAYLVIKRRRDAGAAGAPGKDGKAPASPGASPEAG